MSVYYRVSNQTNRLAVFVWNLLEGRRHFRRVITLRPHRWRNCIMSRRDKRDLVRGRLPVISRWYLHRRARNARYIDLSSRQDGRWKPGNCENGIGAMTHLLSPPSRHLLNARLSAARNANCRNYGSVTYRSSDVLRAAKRSNNDNSDKNYAAPRDIVESERLRAHRSKHVVRVTIVTRRKRWWCGTIARRMRNAELLLSIAHANISVPRPNDEVVLAKRFLEMLLWRKYILMYNDKFSNLEYKS